MRNHELIKELSDTTRYTKREIRNILRSLALVVREAMGSGRDVHLDGIGVLRNVRQAPRRVFNPSKGEMYIGESRRIKFVPASSLRRAVKSSMKLFEEEDLEDKYGLKESNHG